MNQPFSGYPYEDVTVIIIKPTLAPVSSKCNRADPKVCLKSRTSLHQVKTIRTIAIIEAAVLRLIKHTGLLRTMSQFPPSLLAFISVTALAVLSSRSHAKIYR